MTHFGQCPMCHEPITLDRQVGNTFICKCGWTTKISSKPESSLKMDRSSFVILMFAVFLVVGFIQAVNWDKHMFSIIPLKAKQTIGTASTKDLYRISEICADRKKHQCVMESYKNIYAKNPSDIEVLAKLGKVQMQTNDIRGSVDTYRMYFNQGGEDLKSRYEYAKGLGLLGQVEDSRKHFRIVLRAKPGVLQVTVARAYIDMLMTNNMWKDARQAIRYFRKLGSNTGLFLESELKKINERLGNQRKTAGL